MPDLDEIHRACGACDDRSIPFVEVNFEVHFVALGAYNEIPNAERLSSAEQYHCRLVRCIEPDEA